jgi:PIN domain
MMVEIGNTLIFIDSNHYLQIYRLANGPKLLKAIKEQQKHIFITQQVVNEVQRNKLMAAANRRAAQLKDLSQAERCSSISEEIRQEIKGTAKKFKTDTPEILDRVSRSEDDVSKGLADLFEGAVRASTDELQRARLRKERGDPPGKRTDPLGDQLTWEQLLSHAKGKSRLWIISADRDYYLAQNDRRFLNAFLYEELAAVNTPPTQVSCFDDLLKGLKDFAKQTGATADALPTEDETREIEEEELHIREELTAELIPLFFSNRSAMDAANEVIEHYAARQRNSDAYTMSVQGIFPGLLPDKTREENE